MAARPKKCAPTTNEIQAPAACGAFMSPLSRQPDCDGYDLNRYDEPVAPYEAATCQHGGHRGRGTMAREHDQNRHEGGNREEWKSLATFGANAPVLTRKKASPSRCRLVIPTSLGTKSPGRTLDLV